MKISKYASVESKSNSNYYNARGDGKSKKFGGVPWKGKIEMRNRNRKSDPIIYAVIS